MVSILGVTPQTLIKDGSFAHQSFDAALKVQKVHLKPNQSIFQVV